jgi:hypothetical protein
VAAAPSTAVLAVLALILTGNAVAVPVPVAVVAVAAVGSVSIVLGALVAVGLPVIGFIRPFRT